MPTTARRSAGDNGVPANGNEHHKPKPAGGTDMDEAPINEKSMLEHYSAALDEVFRLRRALAYEAQVAEAHFEGYKTFPKTRRPYAEEQVKRMRQAASGHAELAYAGTPYVSLASAAKEAMPRGLSRGQWESQTDDAR